MSNNINTNQLTISNQMNEELFNINYQKRKNVELFQSLEKIANVSKLQNYIPIYSRFFSLNLQNYNSVNLNNKWFISNVYSLCNDDANEKLSNDDDDNDDDDDSMTEDNYINQCLYNCKIKNMLNQKSKEKVVFIKFAPLLDPIRFMTGKYYNLDNNNQNNQNNNTYLYNLPSITTDDINTDNVHPKLLNVNNSAYVDSFFCIFIKYFTTSYKFYTWTRLLWFFFRNKKKLYI